jgi:hypothetical protein
MSDDTRRLLYASLGYLALALVFFLPTLAQLGSALIGPPEDNMALYWNLWWGGRSLFDGDLELFHTTYLFHPEGHSLWLHSLSLTNVLLSIPLGWLLPLPAVYNLLLLSSFVVGGVGAFLLAGRFVENKALCFIAGFIFAFNPFHFAQSLHHLDISTIQFIPFFVLAFYRAKERLRASTVAIAVLCFLLSALGSWYLMTYLLAFMALDLGITSFQARRLDRAGLKAALVIGGIAGVLLLPLFIPMAREFSQHAGLLVKEGGDQTNVFVADLAAFVHPNIYSPFWGTTETDALALPFTGNPWESTVFLGYANLLLLGAVLVLARRGNRYLLWMLGVFLVLSLGTHVHLAGRVLGPGILPYRVLNWIPVMNIGRVPSRMVIMAFLFLGILAASGLQALFYGGGRWVRLLDRSGLRRPLLFLVQAVIILEFMSVAGVNTRVELPAVYGEIPADGETVIMNLPVDGYKFEAAYMMYQTLHGIPMAGGRVSRLTSPGIRGELLDQSPEEIRGSLLRRGVDYLVVHKRLYDAPPGDYFDAWFRRVYEDELHLLYRIE